MTTPNLLFNPYNTEHVQSLPAQQQAEVLSRQYNLWNEAALFNSTFTEDPITSAVGNIVNELTEADRLIARKHGFPPVTPEYASVVIDLAKAVELNMRPRVPLQRRIHLGNSAVALAGLHLGLLGDPELLDEQRAQLAIYRAADSYKKQVIMGIPAMPPKLRRP